MAVDVDQIHQQHLIKHISLKVCKLFVAQTVNVVNLRKIREIKNEALKIIKPTKREIEKQKEIISHLKQFIEKAAVKKRYKFLFIEAEGSTGIKQTQLRGASDIDIFVALSPNDYKDILKLPKRNMRDRLHKEFEKIVKEWFKPAAINAGCTNIKITYAEHPYLSAKISGFDVDILAGFWLEPQELLKHGPITAVDRTPHHSRFVHKNLSKKQKDEVRLLKAFLRACYTYGDTCAIGRSGFTGFSVELLIYFNKTFERVLLNLKNLPKTPIDFFGRKTEELREHPKFGKDFLIIVDPTDPNRNAAASIDKRAYLYTNHVAQKFLINPSKEYFIKKPINPLSLEEERKYKGQLLIIEFKNTKNLHYAVLRDKLYRLASRLSLLLEKEEAGEERFGKTIHEVYFEDPIYALGFYFPKKEIGQYFLRKGPPADMIDHVKKFLQKHPNAFVKNGVYWARIKRKYTKPKDLILDYLLRKDLLSQTNLENIKIISISESGTTSIGRKLATIIVKMLLPAVYPEFL